MNPRHAIIATVILALATSSAMLAPAFAQSAMQAVETNSIAASTASSPAPRRIHLDMTATPPELTPEQAARRDRGPLPQATPLPVGTTAVSRADSVAAPGSATALPGIQPKAPGDFTQFLNNSMGATIRANTSGLTGEPTVVNSGATVFATGNWWAAISADGGQTFSYISPYTMFPASFGGFCCDQMAIYDPARDLFIWTLQYSSSGAPGAGQNIFRLAAAHPSDALNGNWWFYDFASASNTEWDFPGLCVSNDFVYYLSNRGPFGASFVNDSFLFRFPLDPISTAGGFSYSFIDFGSVPLSNLSWRCAMGARDVFYAAAHNSTSQVRIMGWAENSGSFFWNDVNLSTAWPNATRVCPTPDGRDWCGFDDGRIKAGWIGRGMIGFMWNASAGLGFTAPYVEAARFVESTRAYVDRPLIFNPSTAFQYPAAAPNARGDLGVVVHVSNSSWPPSVVLGIDDDVSRDAGFTPGPWELYLTRVGTQGPTGGNRWGDYFSVLPFQPNGLGWIATGQSFQGCGGAGCKETDYMIFGRSRDAASIRNVAACSMDVDGNGVIDPLTDGLMLTRAMFGLTGSAVTNGAIGSGATRTNWSQIQPFLNASCGTAFAP